MCTTSVSKTMVDKMGTVGAGALRVRRFENRLFTSYAKSTSLNLLTNTSRLCNHRDETRANRPRTPRRPSKLAVKASGR